MQDNNQINVIDFLPHRAPFLFIDGVKEFVPNEKLVAVKNVAADDKMLIAEEGGSLRFPETLIVEAAAQTVLLFAKLSKADQVENEGLFVLGKVKAEFLGQAFVGDELALKVEQIRFLAQGGYANVDVKVIDEVIAKIEVFFSLIKGE